MGWPRMGQLQINSPSACRCLFGQDVSSAKGSVQAHLVSVLSNGWSNCPPGCPSTMSAKPSVPSSRNSGLEIVVREHAVIGRVRRMLVFFMHAQILLHRLSPGRRCNLAALTREPVLLAASPQAVGSAARQELRCWNQHVPRASYRRAILSVLISFPISVCVFHMLDLPLSFWDR